MDNKYTIIVLGDNGKEIIKTMHPTFWDADKQAQIMELHYGGHFKIVMHGDSDVEVD